MKLPDVQTAALKKALLKFDFTLRNRPQWTGWEESPEHTYVIYEGEKFYPIKQIVSLATNTDEDKFSLDEARKYVSIRLLKTVNPQEELAKIEKKKAAKPRKSGKKPAPKPTDWENAVIKSYFDATSLVNRLQLFKKEITGSFGTGYYEKEERDYKDKAINNMRALLDREILGELVQKGQFAEGVARMKSVANKHENNMLTMYDQMQLFDIPAEQLVPGLYRLLYGDESFSVRFNKWVEIVGQAKHTCWPIATMYLALRFPETYFFVRPQPTQDFMKAVNSDLKWEPHTSYGYYVQLLKLAEMLRKELQPLASKKRDNKVDMIDVQSFIWILRPEGKKPDHVEQESE